MKKIIITGFVLVIMLLASCSQMKEMTNNNEGRLLVPVIKTGRMQEVVVRIVDARLPNSIPPVIANLTQQFHIISYYQPQISHVMRINGFVPVNYQASLNRKLTIQINNIEYQSATGSMLSSDVLKANIEADALNGIATYSRLYRGQVSVGSIFGSSSPHVADIKQLFTILISKALSDKQLMRFIADDNPPAHITYD